MHDYTPATSIDTGRGEAVCGLPVIVYIIINYIKRNNTK